MRAMRTPNSASGTTTLHISDSPCGYYTAPPPPAMCTSWPPPHPNIRSMVGGSATNTRSHGPEQLLTAVPKRVFACERMFHPLREKPLWHKGFCSLPAVRPCFACVIMRTPVRLERVFGVRVFGAARTVVRGWLPRLRTHVWVG